ncbi:hypothetical protein Tco_0907944 [Tanacetum coccineum]|uniref:Uncharacterized protein n=1 Tax=Tanacetum coccineum TaxID=301880 RepID=A0ABQ5CS70_9ASTR
MGALGYCLQPTKVFVVVRGVGTAGGNVLGWLSKQPRGKKGCRVWSLTRRGCVGCGFITPDEGALACGTAGFGITEQNDFLFADATRMEEIKELSTNICLMARIQPADNTSDDGPSYDSAFISEVQSSSINENEEQIYPTHTKIISSTINDDSDIIFDSPNGNVNSGSVEKDTRVPDQCVLEQLARNAYQEVEKQ